MVRMMTAACCLGEGDDEWAMSTVFMLPGQSHARRNLRKRNTVVGAVGKVETPLGVSKAAVCHLFHGSVWWVSGDLSFRFLDDCRC